MEKEGLEFEKKELDYKDFLEIQYVDIDKSSRTTLTFAVTESFNIFVTTKTHEYLYQKYGVDLSKTLTEGHIFFDKNGDIEKISFKTYEHGPLPGFGGNTEDLTRLNNAVEEKIRETLQK